MLSRLASAGADPCEVAQRLASEPALGDVLNRFSSRAVKFVALTQVVPDVDRVAFIEQIEIEAGALYEVRGGR